MYIECTTWLGENFICKVNFFKGIIILLFNNNSLLQCKRVPKKDLIFDK